jgi:hypothetical protein
MNLPAKIQIGPLSFSVTDDKVEHNQAVVDDLDATYGRIQYAQGKIVLDPDQNEGHRRYVLLHEVLHGCWHIGDRSHKNDEKAIRALTGPLLDVLRRNPDLVAYLMSEDDVVKEEEDG